MDLLKNRDNEDKPRRGDRGYKKLKEAAARQNEIRDNYLEELKRKAGNPSRYGRLTRAELKYLKEHE